MFYFQVQAKLPVRYYKIILGFLETFVSKICTKHILRISRYSGPLVSTNNTFQDLPRLRETVDNIESYIRLT
jgi:hypothetical protein